MNIKIKNQLIYLYLHRLFIFILNLVEINTLEIILISFILFVLFAYAIRTLRLSFKILAGDIRQLQFIIYFSYIFGLFLGSTAAYFLNKEYKLYLYVAFYMLINYNFIDLILSFMFINILLERLEYIKNIL